MESSKLSFDGLKKSILEEAHKNGPESIKVVNDRLNAFVTVDDFLRLAFDSMVGNLALSDCLLAIRSKDDERLSSAIQDVLELTKRQFDNVQRVTERLMGGEEISEGGYDNE